MTQPCPRYLNHFHPKWLHHCFADVLIVGSGIAGLRAALAVDPQLTVLLVTKSTLDESSSAYAQGGIAGVMDPADRFEAHVKDTLTAGGALCDREIVEMVVREAPELIDELIGWGTQFDRRSGALTLGREGGHSHNRVVHALGDATGKEIMRAVIDRICARENVQIWQDTFALDLLTHQDACRGALIWNERFGRTLVWAKQTILCSGGVGQIYRESTNPNIATGDGMAMAYRAGAELRDLEFMQFHPTVLYIAGGSRSLITEAIRGEGAHLVDRHGYRFMRDYDERGELAPRDVVAQAIVTQMEKTQHPSVFLDLGHLDEDFVRQRFPGIAATCSEFGIDIARDKVPVRPGAHYMVGGVTVDALGRTTLPGLWAAGEVGSTGLHGANRLASNSLLEGLVFGRRAGQGASEAASRIPDRYQAIPLDNPLDQQHHEPLDLVDIRNSLTSLMWRAASVRRSGPGLTDAMETIDNWWRYVLVRQFDDPVGWELQNMLIVARLMAQAALTREESRGVHLRTDFPEADDKRWMRRLTVRRPEA